MEATSGALVRRLLDAGALSAEDVVGRGVEVLDRSRAHRLWMVRVADREGLMVKLAADDEGRERIRREIETYRLGARAPRLACRLPRVRLSDPEDGLLAIELLEPSETLHDRAMGRGLEPPAFAALGTALADAHDSLERFALAGRRAEAPWVLHVLEPGAAVSPELRVVLDRLAGRDRAAHGLRRAREAWLPETLVHGDLKLDNCLEVERPGGPATMLVDWELSGPGDPAWDLGGAVEECLAFAGPPPPAAPVSHPGSSGPSAGAAASALTRAAPAIDGLLGAYGQAAARPLGPSFPHRVALFAGARLLQAALEYASRDGEKAPTVGRMAALAVEVLAEPEPLAEAAEQTLYARRAADERAMAPPPPLLDAEGAR